LSSQDLRRFNSRIAQHCTWQKDCYEMYVMFHFILCRLLQGLRSESSLQCTTPKITGHVIRGFTYLFLCALYRIPCLRNKSFLQSTDPLITYKFTAVCYVALLLMLLLHDCYTPPLYSLILRPVLILVIWVRV